MPFKRIEDVKRGIVPFSDHNWRSVSSTVTSLIKGMLRTEPTQRLGITEVLSHSWLKVGLLQELSPPVFVINKSNLI